MFRFTQLFQPPKPKSRKRKLISELRRLVIAVLDNIREMILAGP
jgi:hypothetical protein